MQKQKCKIKGQQGSYTLYELKTYKKRGRKNNLTEKPRS